MIKKLIYYDGERPTREEKVWGLPFKFEKGKPQEIEDRFAHMILQRGSIFKEVRPSDKLRYLLGKKGNNGYKIKVLVIRFLGGLGDVLMNTPVFRALKEISPNIEVTYTCLPQFIPVIKNNPYLDSYMPFDREKIESEDYDAIVDVTRCCAQYEVDHKPYVDLHRSEIYLKEIGLDTTDKRPYYKVEKEEMEWAQKFMDGRTAIGFQLKSAAVVRNWNIENYKKLAKIIKNTWEHIHIVLFDSDDSLIWNGDRIIPFVNRPIRKAAAVIDQCLAMVTVDSGLLHLAGALAKPQVTMFGNIDALCRTKFYPECKVIQMRGIVSCIPCWQNECPEKRCMKEITPEMIFEKLKEVL